jgi:hypothetical protein
MVFWPTRPFVRAAWTLLALTAMLCRGVVTGRVWGWWLAAGLLVWLLGWLEVRWLIMFFVYCLWPLYAALVRGLRLYATLLAYVLLEVARVGHPRVALGQVGWHALDQPKSGFASVLIDAAMPVAGWWRSAFRSLDAVSPALAAVMILPLWALRLLPDAVPYTPPAPGNYTLD